MGKLEMVEYITDKDTDRTQIVVKENTGAFSSNKENVYIDTTLVFASNKEKVFCNFPEMTEIANGTVIHKFLNACYKRIVFEQTGKIE